MAIQVRVNRQKLLLDDWKPVGNKETPNWVRRLNPYDYFSCVGLMVSYTAPKISQFHWTPMFHGPILHELCDIYYQFYPSPKPYMDPFTNKCYSCLSKTLLTFQDYQLQEAKDHLDNFIHRVNSLAVFF